MKNLKKITSTIIGVALISLFTTSSGFAEAPDETDVKDIKCNCHVESVSRYDVDTIYQPIVEAMVELS